MALTISATDTEVQKPVNVIYEQSILRNAQMNATYFTGATPAEVMQHRGTFTALWRRYNTSADHASGIAPSTTALSELTSTAAYGQGRDSNTVHFSNVTSAVAKYGQYYILNEEVDLMVPNADMLAISRTMGVTAGRAANFLHRNQLEDNATLHFAGNVASIGAVVTTVNTGDLDYAINVIDRQYGTPFTPMGGGSQNYGSTPILSAMWAHCHPDVAYDVARLTGFTSVERYANYTQTAPGEFGYYGGAGVGLRFIRTPEASIDADVGGSVTGLDLRSTTGSVADCYTIVVIAENSHGAVGFGQMWSDGIYRPGDQNPAPIQILASSRQVSAADPFGEVSTLAYKFWYGGAILQANWCRGIRVAATKLSN